MSLSHWQIRKRRQQAKTERKRTRKVAAKAKPPSSITHHVGKTFARKPIERPVAVIDPELNWYVVQTNIKCERRAFMGLRERHIACYMPVEYFWVVRKGVKRSIDKPTLSRYLFAGLQARNLAFGDIRGVDGVELILGVQGKPIMVPVAQLQRFEDRLAGKATEPIAQPFMLGSQVRIDGGPFQGFICEVTRALDERNRVKVAVEIFGRMQPMEFELEQLRAA